MKTTVALLVSAALVSACATPVHTNYRPVVDTKGVDMNTFETDLNECRAYSTQVMNEQQSAATGAVAGAVFGAAIGALLGVRGRDLSGLAGATALTGAASGAGHSYQSQTDIVKSCLAQRGYRVLGG